ncbi:MAG TPA: plastocyanin/azurin family copper-binding protein [Solirubrobacteraceae bacterium]|jgi:plastocyanin|nr:plastocyanin/azurin family copper-binding protein [Solirubrobacteraceae bacterium]
MKIGIRLALVLAIVACSAAAAAELAKGPSVKVADNVFRPTSLSIKKGATVTWRWAGRNPHNVTVTDGPRRFRSPTQKRGSFSHRFTARGAYTIVCTIHSGMVMHLKVR